MNLQDTLDTKIKELRALQIEVRELQAEVEAKEKYPKLKKLIGTHWKYINSYSCPSNPSDYWPIYRKVLRVKKSCELLVSSLEVDSYGEIRCRKKWLSSDSFECTNGNECSAGEFKAAHRKLIRLLQDISKDTAQ